jgi:nucleotide-binding universal stress UspA family protein
MCIGMAYVPADMIETYRAQAIKLLDEARAIATAAGVSCETEVADVQGVNDSVAECLQRSALIYGAQLAVLGTHGRRGFRRALLGSVAEQFVRLAPCSVLLVRGKGE